MESFFEYTYFIINEYWCSTVIKFWFLTSECYLILHKDNSEIHAHNKYK